MSILTGKKYSMQNIILQLPDIIKNSIKKAEKVLQSKDKGVFIEELILKNSEVNDKELNIIYHSDNIETIKDLLDKGYNEKIDLIYIDPPFYSLANYNNKVQVRYGNNKETIEYQAYKDTWKYGFKEYLEMLAIRLFLMRELLSEEGSIYIHLDFRAVHYIKIIMDYIFGETNFLNEIVWSYKSGGTSSKHFSRKHDNILVYAKSQNYIFNPQKEKSYNRGYKPYRFKGVKEYEDSLGWYTLVNLKDVWHIDMVGRTSRERVGYGTQKPEALLERIILSSSKEGSMVADFFAGSGTTLAVSEKHNRRFVGSDIGNSSLLTIKKRLMVSYKVLKKESIENKSKIIIEGINICKSTNNSMVIKLKLDSYKLDLGNITITKKYKDLIFNIIKEDSLALIDYIGVGTIGDTPTIVFEQFRDAKELVLDRDITFQMTAQNRVSQIYIKTIDIFGNETTKLISEN